MAAPSGSAPTPGPITRFLMARRLAPSQRDLLLTELEELYEHRADADGHIAADRWIRREYRRWGWRLLRGGIDVSVSASDSIRPGSSGGRGVLRDLRHNLRGLRRAPLFSLALTLTVGLGIGGTTLVFSVVHAVLVAPLPYPDSDRLVYFRTVNGPDMWSTSMADLEALYEPPPAFETVAGYSYRNASIDLPGGVELVRSKWVTASYFPMLGVEPVLGRTFTPEESAPGAADVVMLKQSFAETVFGSGVTALGSALRIDGRPHSVVGILPDRIGPLEAVAVYPALRVETPPRKGPFFFPMIGRLAAGVDRSVARRQLDAVAEAQFPIWRDSFPLENATIGFLDLKEILVGSVARTLLIVLAAMPVTGMSHNAFGLAPAADRSGRRLRSASAARRSDR